MKLLGTSINWEEELFIIGLSKRSICISFILFLLSMTTSSPPNVFLITFKFLSNSAAFCLCCVINEFTFFLASFSSIST